MKTQTSTEIVHGCSLQQIEGVVCQLPCWASVCRTVSLALPSSDTQLSALSWFTRCTLPILSDFKVNETKLLDTDQLLCPGYSKVGYFTGHWSTASKMYKEQFEARISRLIASASPNDPEMDRDGLYMFV